MSPISNKTNIPRVLLNNGTKIPAIGFGPDSIGYTSKYRMASKSKIFRFIKRAYNKTNRKLFGERAYINAIINAFQLGFSLLDYSAAYGNEQLLGKAINNCGVKRENLFLTTRVSNKQQYMGNIREEFFKTLKCYQTDYVDLYMLHWPVADIYLNTWKQIEQLYKEGYCKSIGIANCHQHHIEKILEIAEFVPQINQIEIHPLFTQKSLIEYCKEQNIIVEAYTPIARMNDRLVNLRALKMIASKYQKSIVQVILRWHFQNEVIPIVRSLNKQRQFENLSIFDFTLTSEEMNSIDSFNINSRLRYDPDNCDFSAL